ncbi:hypothetical protein J1N35_046051 [Gossypium stocksii]|uniref:Uncharacterized protein n=1 Tax=Gossypium stocksii TaxID=47602 RepID=A0A9D3U594_9ROSI|nr:hypothetical protein J1N35_046051 [Gossypium stocksii]
MDELRYELQSLFEQYLGHPNPTTSNTATSAKGTRILGALFPRFIIKEPIEVSIRGRVHVLGNLSIMDFIDKNMTNLEPIKPPSIEYTLFKLGEEIKDMELTAKLRNVDDFTIEA